MRFNKGMAVRGISAVVAIAAVSFLAACGGGGGGGSNLTSVAIGLVPSVRSLGPAGVATITASVTKGGLTWTISSPAGFGTLSNAANTGVTYTAPSTVPAPMIVTITATSTSSTSVSAPVQIAVQPSPAIALQIGGNTVGPQTINAGHQVSVNAVLTGDTTNAGVTWSLSGAVGTLSNVTTTSVTYIAPGSVSTNTPITLTATSAANTGSTAVLNLTVFPTGAAGNVATLTTQSPSGLTNPSFNTFYTSVTVCVPGTSNCQTIDNIEIDTGSEGLRILQSALTSIVLPQQGDGVGDYSNNCVSFLDGSYFWGPVAAADIYIGGQKAHVNSNGTEVGVPIQLISSGDPTVPTACSQGGTKNENTLDLLGANGLLGIGLEPSDCFLQGTDFCDGVSTSSIQPAYFLCPSSGCLSTDGPSTASISLNQEILNPVVAFDANSNGSSITFPTVSTSSPVANGSLTFGIPANFPASIVLNVDASDFFSTTFPAIGGQALSSSFIDSGSNGLFFPSSIPTCTTSTGFYCPTATQNLSAINVDPSGTNPSNTVSFSIDNADNLPADTALSTIGGPGGAGFFDWGAPFFYGRTIFTGIDSSTQSPFVAY